MNSPFLEAALRYAALGLFIFPLNSIQFDKKCGCGREDCRVPGKHPRIKWKAGATCDIETVRAYWTKWPNAGIGCATGPSGLLVADADGPKGVFALRDVVGQLPVTARSRTGRGVHVFFSGEGGTRGDPDSQLDTRGAGGYVVLPPSPHVSGRVYSWDVPPWSSEGQLQIADAPEALIAWSLQKWKRGLVDMPGRGLEAAPVPRPPYLPEGLPELQSGHTGDFTRRLAGCLESPDWNEVDRALEAIPADCKMDTWIRVGMALHSTGHESAWRRWDQWSSKGGDKYRGQNETGYKWTTFKVDGGVGLGTLFAIAKEHGYARGDNPTGQNTDTNGQDGGMNGHTSALPAIFSVEKTIHFPDVSEGGKVKPTCRNVRAAMRHLGIVAEEDEFHDRMRIGGQPLGQWAGELTDNAVFALRSLIEREFGFDPPTTATFEAAVQECLANRHHPIKSYFDSLRWDRTPRLDTWLCRYLGANNDPFNRAVSRLSLIAAVRRILQPGCKFDQIIVLEGVEGKGKSSAIEILAGKDNFSDQLILGLRDKEQQEVIQGVWLYEIADLAGHGHAEVEKVKAFASRTIDRARPAYGRKRVDIPRRCIFFGTTNDRSYLKSQTGNRRFWPVECHHVDLDALRRDRDQLWAEAVVAERGASLVLPEALWGNAAALQESRRSHDPWDDKLSNLERTTWAKLVETVDGQEWRVPSRTLLDDVLGLPSDRQSDVAAKRLAYAMRRLGWENKHYKLDGFTHRGFIKRVTAGDG